jgi:hypothetical protein
MTAIHPPIRGVGGIILVEVGVNIFLEGPDVGAVPAPERFGNVGSEVDAIVEVSIALGSVGAFLGGECWYLNARGGIIGTVDGS